MTDWIYEVMDFSMGLSEKAAVGLEEMNEAMKKKAESMQVALPSTLQKPEESKELQPVLQSEAPKVRLGLKLDITAPLILVPSSILNKNGNTSFLLVDLGHILITHDSGPIDEISDYGTFLIRLKRLGAYIQESDQAMEEDKAVIRPFSIDLDIGTRASKDVSLPATRIRANLDKFKVCVTKEKLRDLIQVVTSIQPPPPHESDVELQKRQERLKRGSQQISESVSASVSASISELAEKATTQEQDMALDAIFKLTEFCVSVKDTGDHLPAGGQPLLKTRIKQLEAKVIMSNWETKAELALDAYVTLFARDQPYLGYTSKIAPNYVWLSRRKTLISSTAPKVLPMQHMNLT